MPMMRRPLEAVNAYFGFQSPTLGNGARHAIETLWPEITLGGSTHGLAVKATTYDMAGNQLCLKCYNPVAERNELVKKRLEEARAMDSIERIRFFAGLGVDPAKANEHLRDLVVADCQSRGHQRHGAADCDLHCPRR
jgi:hypothetical protein